MTDDDVERVARAIATLRTAAYADDKIWAEDVDWQRRSIDPTSPFNLARAALSAMPQRELLREAMAYAHQLEDCVAEFLDAYTAFNNDELDEVSMNDAEHEMKLAMRAFRAARAAIKEKTP